MILVAGLVLGACGDDGGSDADAEADETVTSISSTSMPADVGDPSAGRIVFAQDEGMHADLFAISPDGTALERLTSSEGEAGRPDVSPDGTTIVYEDALQDSAVIALIDANGENRRVLTPDGFQGQPSWSPDGASIVFERDVAPGDNGVWIMDADGSNLRRLTRNPFGSERANLQECACDTDPVFSPDGTRISFVRIQSESDATAALFIMDADGSNIVQVTPWDFDPIVRHAWKPDGSLIMLSSNGHPTSGESSNLFVMQPDGSGQQALTDFDGGTFNALAGAWSPDGTQMVYKTDESGDFQLYVANGDGSDPQQITSDLKEPHDVTWGASL